MTPSGAGKSYIAQAIGMAACRAYKSVRYTTMQDMFEQLQLAKEESIVNLHKLREGYSSPDLLIIDDFLTTEITKPQQDELFNILQKGRVRVRLLL